MKEQKGFASLFAICVLLILSLLGMTAYMVTQKELKSSRQFSVQAALRMEAQNGIIAACNDIKVHPERVAAVSSESSALLWKWEDTARGMDCRVYARREGTGLRLLSESGKGKQKTRVYARIEGNTHDGYRIVRWGAL